MGGWGTSHAGLGRLADHPPAHQPAHRGPISSGSRYQGVAGRVTVPCCPTPSQAARMHDRSTSGAAVTRRGMPSPVCRIVRLPRRPPLRPLRLRAGERAGARESEREGVRGGGTTRQRPALSLPPPRYPNSPASQEWEVSYHRRQCRLQGAVVDAGSHAHRAADGLCTAPAGEGNGESGRQRRRRWRQRRRLWVFSSRLLSLCSRPLLTVIATVWPGASSTVSPPSESLRRLPGRTTVARTTSTS